VLAVVINWNDGRMLQGGDRPDLALEAGAASAGHGPGRQRPYRLDPAPVQFHIGRSRGGSSTPPLTAIGNDPAPPGRPLAAIASRFPFQEGGDGLGRRLGTVHVSQQRVETVNTFQDIVAGMRPLLFLLVRVLIRHLLVHLSH
jgi:hypothetical protein